MYKRQVRIRGRMLARGAAVTLLTLAALGAGTRVVRATDAVDTGSPRYTVEVVTPQPVVLPDDVLLAPYEADPAQAQRVMVPYDEFERLWRLANRDAESLKKPPTSYALGGAQWRGVLKDGDAFVLRGIMEVEVFVDEYVEVPLPLDGCVLVSADLDGAPALLRHVREEIPTGAKPVSQRARGLAPIPSERSIAYLYLSGKGRHLLTLEVRSRFDKQGGWRAVRARLPAAPASMLEIEVPEAGTEIVLTGIPDRSTFKTEAANAVIRTALAVEGLLELRWRPKVGLGELDRSMMIESSVLYDVQEDGVRAVWQVIVRFRHGEHGFFTLEVPAAYRVQKVVGNNVRGWEVTSSAADGPSSTSRLRVDFLQQAKEQEQFTIVLSKSGPVPGLDEEEEIEVPWLHLAEAVRHTGRLAIRHSPLLVVRTTGANGASRIDMVDKATLDKLAELSGQSPLGIRLFEAYQFVAVPFHIKLLAKPLRSVVTAQLHSILRVAERDRTLETKVDLQISDRPIYLARIAVPSEMEVEHLTISGAYEWNREIKEGQQVLNIHFGAGRVGNVPLVIQGRLGRARVQQEITLPQVAVIDVRSQVGDLAILTDPGFEVRPKALSGITPVLVDRVSSWLRSEQRPFARLALHYETPGYRGTLALVPVRPDISSVTMMNIRVTDRSIEETVLLDFTIRNAGIREVEFSLPAHMADSRISVPLLRQ
ncbi:MAG: hypothetical protein N2255_04710, partial [Kiritimatiellae bacterium]|nr:hypothetical protein [Kiritimatiellia bacterium]